MQTYEYITSRLTERELLNQLAGDARVLAHAAFAVAHVIGGDPAVSVRREEALDALVEEIAGVNVAATAVLDKLDISHDRVAEVEDAKAIRWERRLRDVTGTTDRD